MLLVSLLFCVVDCCLLLWVIVCCWLALLLVVRLLVDGVLLLFNVIRSLPVVII